MDLFYGSTPEEQLRSLKRDIKTWAKSKYNYDFGNKRLYVAWGKSENIGNNILIVTTPLLQDAKPFEDNCCSYIKHLLIKHNILKFFMTPNFIIPKDKVTKSDIKDYSRLVDNLVDIIQPKLIVTLGEDSTFAFFRRKFILRDYHGKVIGSSKQGIPIILTYSADYYTEKSEYEDPSFKNFISDNDWTVISSMYKERIK